LCEIESYAPTDNVPELTARTNDEGWESTFRAWLETSRLGGDDALLVFSVGGGSLEHGVSVNVVNALELARERGTSVYGVVGAPGGALAQAAAVAVLVAPPADLRAARRVVPSRRVARPGVASGAGAPSGTLGGDHRSGGRPYSLTATG
jgi:D-sedoheptulose 7-phosphate isomerase